MKELEKIVKESFQDFEPEVNPSVWQRLEQNLPVSQPVDPSAAVSGSKGALVASGKIAAWVAGAITTAAVTTAIVLSVNSEKNESATVTVENPSIVIEAPATQNTVSENTYQQKQNNIEALPEEENTSKQNPQKTVQPADNQTTPLQAPVEILQESDQVLTNENAAAGDSKQNDPVIEKAVAPTIQASPSSPVRPATEEIKNIEPLIIVSSDCGFAPLKVIAILNNESSKGNWDFGDGYAISSSATATHVYEKPGSYEINYTDGEITIKRTVEVIGTVSTAFTPNGDGLNDEFYINAALEELKMKIFDRSGHLAIEINNPHQRWDGRSFNGDDLPSGTYFYDIFARSANGKTISQKGTINIFR